MLMLSERFTRVFMKLLTTFLGIILLLALPLRATDAPKAPDPQVAELKLRLANAEAQATWYRAQWLALVGQFNARAAKEALDGLSCGEFKLVYDQQGQPTCVKPDPLKPEAKK